MHWNRSAVISSNLLLTSPTLYAELQQYRTSYIRPKCVDLNTTTTDPALCLKLLKVRFHNLIIYTTQSYGQTFQGSLGCTFSQNSFSLNQELKQPIDINFNTCFFEPAVEVASNVIQGVLFSVKKPAAGKSVTEGDCKKHPGWLLSCDKASCECINPKELITLKSVEGSTTKVMPGGKA